MLHLANDKSELPKRKNNFSRSAIPILYVFRAQNKLPRLEGIKIWRIKPN
jgi:hypothetical protein